MLVEDSNSKHKVFWDEVEQVAKSDKHGGKPGVTDASVTGVTPRWKPSEPGMVDPAAVHKALEAAG